MKVQAVNIDNIGQEHQTITPKIKVEDANKDHDDKGAVDAGDANTGDDNGDDTDKGDIDDKGSTNTDSDNGDNKVDDKPIEITDDDIKKYIKKQYNIDSLDEALKTKETTLPEDIAKYIEWKKEKGGGTMNDYLNVTKDWSKAKDDDLINAYLKQTKPHLESSEIEFEINRMFAYDDEVDTDSDIMAKKIAKKDLVKSARDFFEENSKNFTPSRLGDTEIPAEYIEALDFKKSIDIRNSEATALKEKQRNLFNTDTEKYFSDDFKGFDFVIGDNKESKKYIPSDVDSLKSNNSDLTNMLKKYVDESGAVTDVAGYHRAIAIASDPDSFAKFFYDEGKSNGIEEITNTSKNRSFTPNKIHSNISGESSVRKVNIAHSDYKFKLRPKK